MTIESSLLFFEYGDFVWEFVGDPARPLGRWVGEACRESVPPFGDFTATITVYPKRPYPDSRLHFSMESRFWLDSGNHSFCARQWPPYNHLTGGQSEDAVLEDAKLAAYRWLKQDYDRCEYHLMP